MWNQRDLNWRAVDLKTLNDDALPIMWLLPLIAKKTVTLHVVHVRKATYSFARLVFFQGKVKSGKVFDKQTFDDGEVCLRHL